MPEMSLSVVIKGPVATAGSIFILSSSNGRNVPNNDANITTENMAEATVNVSAWCEPIKKL